MENAIYTPEGYTDRIRQELENCLIGTNLSEGEKVIAKVRDLYDLGDRMALITTDRQVHLTECWPPFHSKDKSSI